MRVQSNIFLAAASLLLVACQEEPQELFPQKEQAGITMAAPEISAELETGDTKSVLEVMQNGVGKIYWTPEDEINVFYGITGTHYVSQNTTNVSAAVFKTTDVIGINEFSSENIWGLYPYDQNATCDGESVSTTLPAAQSGVPGTFDDDLFITLSHSTSTALPFYNVCGGIMFSLLRPDIASVTFRGNNNEDLAGAIRLSVVDDLPSVSVTAGLKEITVTPKTGATFASGEFYCIVLLPVTLTEGFTMTFTTAGDETGVFTYSDKSLTVKRSVFARVADIDTHATFPGPTNLSLYGTANSYMVSAPGTYTFEAVKGNSYQHVGDVKGVKVLWESFGTTAAPAVGDLIKADVSYEDGYITFETNDVFKEGNAVIAAYSDALCSEGNVLWSWHIWLTDRPAEQVYANNAGTMMDRNLGATSAVPGEVETYGLMYQWGRKDPFLGSGTHPASQTLAASTLVWPGPVVSDDTYGTLDYATKHPTTYIGRGSGTYDWVHGAYPLRWSASTKALYDPCPPGWHVPGLSVWTVAGFPDHAYVPYDTENRGSTFEASLCGSNSWYPATGYYDNQPTIRSFDSCYLWSSSYSNDWGWCYLFSRGGQDDPTKAFAATGTFEKYYGMPVRCCKDAAE